MAADGTATLSGFGSVLGNITAAAFILVLLSSGTTWLMGSDRSQAVAGYDGGGPRILGTFSAKYGTPIVVNFLSGTVSTIVMVLAFQLSGGDAEKYFNAVLNVVLLFTTVSYLAIFPALIKLRYSHGHVYRPYKVPFGMAGVWICGCLTTFWALFASLVGFFPGLGDGGLLNDDALPEGFSRGTFELVVFIPFAITLLIGIGFYIAGAGRGHSWRRARRRRSRRTFNQWVDSRRDRRVTVNRMVESLDAVFHALSSEPRRVMLGALAEGERTVGDLALAVRHLARRGLQAPQGARGRGAGRAARGGADDDLPAAPGAARRRARVGGVHRAVLDHPPRPAGEALDRGGRLMEFAVALDRVIAAPRAKVYRAWLDPEVLARWMGPHDYSVVVATVDERVGGEHVVEMIDADGEHHTFTSVIEELVPDERIVLTFKFHPDAPETLLTRHVQRRRGRRDAAAARARADHGRAGLDRPERERGLEPDARQVASALRQESDA